MSTYSFSSIIFFINSFDMKLLIEISHGILPHDIIGSKREGDVMGEREGERGRRGGDSRVGHCPFAFLSRRFFSLFFFLSRYTFKIEYLESTN
jgi:hypothetical protein